MVISIDGRRIRASRTRTATPRSLVSTRKSRMSPPCCGPGSGTRVDSMGPPDATGASPIPVGRCKPAHDASGDRPRARCDRRAGRPPRRHDAHASARRARGQSPSHPPTPTTPQDRTSSRSPLPARPRSPRESRPPPRETRRAARPLRDHTTRQLRQRHICNSRPSGGVALRWCGPSDARVMPYRPAQPSHARGRSNLNRSLGIHAIRRTDPSMRRRDAQLTPEGRELQVCLVGICPVVRVRSGGATCTRRAPVDETAP